MVPAVCLATVLALVGCTSEGPGSAPTPDPSGTGAAPTGSPTDPPATARPVLGASHVLVPAPGDDGLLVVSSPSETGSADGPMLLWRWDGSGWSEVTPDGPAPDARSFFGAALDERRDVLVVYGGENAEGFSAETWEWDGRAWTEPDAPGPTPGPRAAPSLTWDPASALVLLHSGHRADGLIPDDTWSWDGQAWTRLSRRGPAPGRWPAATVADGDGRVLLVGGHQVADEDLPGALADTWSWTGDEWLPEPGAGGPGPLVNAGAVLHPRLGPLLVGGSGRDRATGDVWRWRAAHWEPLARGVFPRRQGFGLAYDADRHTVVLTGGVVRPGEPARHQDVWEWSGDPGERAVRVLRRPPA